MTQIAAYGSWASPITTELIVADTVSPMEIALDAADVYWIEMRPQEGGRYVIVRRAADGTISDVIPPPFNARTRVHEYGGGAMAVCNGHVAFSNFTDQQLHLVAPAQPLSPAPARRTSAPALRFADGDLREDAPGILRMFCVTEDHRNEGEAVNGLAVVDLASGAIRPLVRGCDFYAYPRVSPCGTRIAWQCWNHPNMPWDGSELWTGDLRGDSTVGHARLIAGGESESILQPEWSSDGVLHFISDRTGWWNLYRYAAGAVESLCPLEADFGRAQWTLGARTYAFVSPTKIVCTYGATLALLDTTAQKLEQLDTPYTSFSSVHAGNGKAVFIGASPTEPASVVQLDLATRKCLALRRSNALPLDARFVSVAQPVEFPTENGLTAHAFFYPPKNDDFAAPQGELPPLLVKSHGGPTSATSSALNLDTQFWTSRGIGVLDVNYGGSTGYGRAYRQRLNGQWGVVDVDDCVNGALHLVRRGWADSNRLMIRGSSAGGYTTLAALTFRAVFKAGASHFGISDLEAMTRETHKFESRYLDRLIGPYPARSDLYRERSPLHHLDAISAPMILLQGLEDKVVPPNQAEMMVSALRAKGLPVAYVPFAGEQHGFRQAQSIRRALEAELYFYSRVFGFTLADQVEPVSIENL